MPLQLSDLLTLGGISAFTLLAVQLLKGYLPSRLVPVVAVVLGALVAVGASIFLGQTTGAQLGQAALTGLLGGFASSGIYELQKPIAVLPAKAPTDPVPS